MARIRVKLADGRIGTIEDTEFNPQNMTRLDTPSPTPSPTPTTTTQVARQENIIEKFNLMPALGAILGGGAGFFGGGPIGAAAGAGIGGAGGEALEQVLFGKPNVRGLAGEAAISAVAPGVGSLALKAARPVVQPVARVGTQALSKVLAPIGKQASTQVLRATGTVFEKAAERGIDIRQAFRKYPFKGNFENMLGQLNNFIKPAEAQIQTVIKQTGTKKTIPTQSAFDALEKELNVLKEGLDTSKAKSLQTFIDNARKKFGDKITAQAALAFKRAADSKFGQAVLEEEKGAVISQGQKIIANAFRGELKNKYGAIAEALDIESELLTLRPILKKAQGLSSTTELFPTGLSSIVLGAGAVGGAGLGGLGGALPGALTAFGGFSAARAGLRNPRIFSALARLGAPQPLKIIRQTTKELGGRVGRRGETAIGQILLRGAGLTFPEFTPREQIETEYQQSTFPTETKGADKMNVLRSETADIINQVTKTPQGLDPKRVALAMLAYPKHAALIKSVAEVMNKGGAGNLELSDTAIKNITDMQGAVSDVQSLYQTIGREGTYPGKGTIAKLPGAVKAKTLQAEIDRVKQAVGKALEGGVLRKEDEEKYKKILPTISDPKEVALNKLEQLNRKINEDLRTYIDLQRQFGKGADQPTGSQDLLNLLYQSE